MNNIDIEISLKIEIDKTYWKIDDVAVYLEDIEHRCGYDLILSGEKVCYENTWSKEQVATARALRKKYDQLFDAQALADEFAEAIADIGHEIRLCTPCCVHITR